MKFAICGLVAEAGQFFFSLTEFIKQKGNSAVFVEPDYSGGVWLVHNKIEFFSSSQEKIIYTLTWKNEYDSFLKYELRLIDIKYKKEEQIIHQKAKLKREAERLLNFYCHFFQENTIDVLLFWNGFQLNSAVARIAAELLSIKCLYFEKSLIPYYLQIDTNGINYDNSNKLLLSKNLNNGSLQPINYFINLIEKKQPVHNPLSKINKLIKIKYLLKERKLDDFLSIVMSNLKSFTNKIRYGSLEVSDKPNIIQEKDFIFFPLQVNNDTQLVCYGNAFISNVKAIKEISGIINQLDPTCKILIKMHPDERDSRENYKIKKLVNELNNCFISYKSTTELIKKSKFTITINSSVGFEAILLQTPVVVLGNSLYSDSNFVFKINDLRELKQIYSKIVNNRSDDFKVIQFANAMENILVQCNFINPLNPELELVWNCMSRMLVK